MKTPLSCTPKVPFFFLVAGGLLIAAQGLRVAHNFQLSGQQINARVEKEVLVEPNGVGK